MFCQRALSSWRCSFWCSSTDKRIPCWILSVWLNVLVLGDQARSSSFSGSYAFEPRSSSHGSCMLHSPPWSRVVKKASLKFMIVFFFFFFCGLEDSYLLVLRCHWRFFFVLTFPLLVTLVTSIALFLWRCAIFFFFFFLHLCTFFRTYIHSSYSILFFIQCCSLFNVVHSLLFLYSRVIYALSLRTYIFCHCFVYLIGWNVLFPLCHSFHLMTYSISSNDNLIFFVSFFLCELFLI